MSELGWREQRERAKVLWANGANTKSIAAALDVSIESARKHIKKWEREDLGDKVYKAIQILKDNGFSENEIAVVTSVPKEEVTRFFRLKQEKINLEVAASMFPDSEIMQTSVDILELSVRAANVVSRLGVLTLGQLSRLSEAEIVRIEGCGRKTIQEIKEELSRHGLQLSPVTPLQI